MSELKLECQSFRASGSEDLTAGLAEYSSLKKQNMLAITVRDNREEAIVVITKDQAIQLIQHLKTQFGI